MQQLIDKDRLGVIAYDSNVDELLPLSKTSPFFKEQATIVLRELASGTCTNLSGGLFMGVKQQQDNLFTDWDHLDTPLEGKDDDSVPSPSASSQTEHMESAAGSSEPTTLRPTGVISDISMLSNISSLCFPTKFQRC